MNYLIDAHTHTIASGHAYSTILEMANAAKEKGLSILGITEHGPAMPGSSTQVYFSNLRVVERHMYGVELLIGVELNIMDYGGGVDLGGDLIKEMDITIASLHKLCIGSGSMEQNTAAILGAIKNPLVDIIGHPDDGHFPLDYEKVVLAAKEYNKPLEVNNSSLSSTGFRINARENYMEMLKYCIQYEVPVIIDSDAHFVTAVGGHGFADKVITEMNFPKELILNYDVEKFKKYVQKYKNI